MPKSKLKVNRGGHTVSKGKGSVYQRSALKKEERRVNRREAFTPAISDVEA